MFGFGKKIEIEKMDINQAFEKYEKNSDSIIIVCIDELRYYDDRHIDGAECLPYRLLKDFKDYYPEKDITYYIYSINAAISEKGTKELVKLGYHAVDLGSFVGYRGPEDGLKVKKKHRRRK